jgi:sterol desaturase/sphingolipid hydroxylase (fatty acid hydroxylase superfamily)/rhodanese-related sulfurtransferase
MTICKQIGIIFASVISLLLVLVLVFALKPHQTRLALAEWSVRRHFPDVRRITTKELAGWLADTHRQAPLLLDARTEAEFDVSHLPDAMRELSPAIANHGTPIVVYSSIGWRSAERARQLSREGFTNVFNLEGSIFAWAIESRPLEGQGKPVRKVHPFDADWGRLLPDSLRSDEPNFGENMLEQIRPLRWGAGPVFLCLLLWWETLTPFFPLFNDGWRKRSLHGLRNITFALINSGLTALLFVGLWSVAANWAEGAGFGLLNWSRLPLSLHAAAAVLALDFWTYWWHRLNHRIPFLWRFHRAHHSDTHMDVTTASRFHIGEILFSNCLRVPLIALVGIHIWEIVLYETMLLAVIQFHHANLGLPAKLDQLLRCFIVTPAMHKVHHSRWQPETDSNYSSLLSVWDRIFSSFRLRDDPRTIQFGLDDFARPEDQTLSGILKTPLNDGSRPKL